VYNELHYGWCDKLCGIIIQKMTCWLLLYTNQTGTYRQQRSHLYFFMLVELHCPDHVMRQFGWRQHIPVHIDTNDLLHVIS